MKMRAAIGLGAALMLAVPAPAQSVRAGIEAWQKGDHATAVAVWTPLAARGDADAAFNLGQAFRLGKGVAIDLGRAYQYLEQAARNGHVDAAATLGILMFQNGNRTGAMRWIKLAAAGGEPRSLLLYGVALYNGDGVAADPVSAYAYVSRAAAQGMAGAKDTLTDMDATMTRDQRAKGTAMALAMVKARQGPVPKAVAVAPAKTARPLPAPTPVALMAPFPASGDWRIQLGAFGQRSSAEALFTKLRGKVAGRQAFYVPAGKVIRLQIGPYASRAAAASACAGLSGQACFPVAAR
ncbi:MAG: SPOR domain-containing protein [Pseudomonadota bacterium]|nr:SPOR domain-containing protein [Pseudomonadota bacterium]